MPNTLGLDDDLAPNELVAELEASFGFRFTNSELGSLRTVGDIFAVIRGRYAQTSDGANRCATAMAFYRIRRACAGFNARAKLTPDTRLDAFNTLTVKAFCKQIKARTGLRLPRLGFTPMGPTGHLVHIGRFPGRSIGHCGRQAATVADPRPDGRGRNHSGQSRQPQMAHRLPDFGRSRHKSCRLELRKTARRRCRIPRQGSLERLHRGAVGTLAAAEA
jgi:hypothetical protein